MLIKRNNRIVRRPYRVLKKELIFYYSLHQKLWNILADNPGMYKAEALEKYFTDEEREKFGNLRCTACEYKHKSISDDRDPDCKHCPLDDSHVLEEYPELSKWSDDCLHGLFDEWDKLTWDIIYCYKGDKELCSKYARAIANLKPKDGVKYI